MQLRVIAQPRRRLAACAALALLVLNLAACSSWQTVDVTPGVQGFTPFGVDVGKLAKVTTLEGRKAEFRITEMNDTGIGGSEGFFRYDQMRSLQLDAPGEGSDKALSVFLTILGLAALVALIANADSVRACSPPCEPEAAY